jgi:hypothetical protein
VIEVKSGEEKRSGKLKNRYKPESTKVSRNDEIKAAQVLRVKLPSVEL